MRRIFVDPFYAVSSAVIIALGVVARKIWNAIQRRRRRLHPGATTTA
jgi:hypothetical protein